jgi:flagellar motor switch protein FliM
MTVQPRDPVLRRKTVPRAPSADPTPAAPVGPAQGLGRAFARAVSAAAPLVAEGGSTRRRTVSQSELLDCFDGDAFVGLLTPGDGGPGLAILDQSGFSTVIEAMTIGRLGPRAPLSRRPTPTDASLLADLIDATLAALADDGVGALRFDRAVPDLRLLPVLLDDTQFHLVSRAVTLVCGGERREAQVTLAIPVAAEAADDAPDGPAIAGAVGQNGQAGGWAQALEASVLRAPASLRAELGRITLPLARVLDLGVGGALTLPLANLEEVQLVALDGSVQAIGRLGQSRGMRAVRLTSWPNGHPPEPRMTDAAPPGSPSLVPKLDAPPEPQA